MTPVCSYKQVKWHCCFLYVNNYTPLWFTDEIFTLDCLLNLSLGWSNPISWRPWDAADRFWAEVDLELKCVFFFKFIFIFLPFPRSEINLQTTCALEFGAASETVFNPPVNDLYMCINTRKILYNICYLISW